MTILTLSFLHTYVYFPSGEGVSASEAEQDGRPLPTWLRPGWMDRNNTPLALQPIPIPPGYKLVQDKNSGQMFLLPGEVTV
jgi:hypothetical protein